MLVDLILTVGLLFLLRWVWLEHKDFRRRIEQEQRLQAALEKYFPPTE